MWISESVCVRACYKENGKESADRCNCSGCKEHLLTILYFDSLALYTCSPRFDAALTDPFIPDMI